jgi:hypothetical protein
VSACVRACLRACVRACVRVCVCVRARACVRTRMRAQVACRQWDGRSSNLVLPSREQSVAIPRQRGDGPRVPRPESCVHPRLDVEDGYGTGPRAHCESALSPFVVNLLLHRRACAAHEGAVGRVSKWRECDVTG